MLKRKPFKLKKTYSLKKTGFKSSKIYTLKKTKLKPSIDTNLQKTEIKKQSDKAKACWEEARKRCIIRCNGKCQVCGKKGTQVHHIILRSKRKDLLYADSNLILLCDKHHLHKGSDKYDIQCKIIAEAKHITVEELLKQAEGGINE